jgi:hypothetical protein
MEKAPGIEVSKVWPRLSEKHRLRLVDEIVRIEKATLVHPLPSYGSIFFRSDVPLSSLTRLPPSDLPWTEAFGVMNEKL